MKARRENERGNIIPRTCYVIVAVAFIFLHFSDKGLNFVSEQIASNRRMSATAATDATDCSSQQTSETGEPLFGSVLHVPHPSYLIVAAIITIVLVNIVENWFLILMKMTDDTPYSEMITLIERELMNVGFTALLFKVVFNNTHFLDHEWFFALELSDVLVPFYVFCSCSVGILLVITAMKQCFVWSRAFHLQLEEILDEYHHNKFQWWMTYFAPLSSVMNQIEFRVLNILFCDSFSINRTVHFDEYVAIVLEKFILDLIEIRPSDWAILLSILSLILVMSNWTNGASFYGSPCEAEDRICKNQKAVELFTIFGGLVFLITCSIAAVARMYEKRLLRLSGAKSASDYTDYLQLEKQRNMNGVNAGTIMSDQALMASLKACRHKEKTHSVGYYIQMYPMLLLKTVQSLFAQEDKIAPDSVENIRKMTDGSGGFEHIHNPKKTTSNVTATTTTTTATATATTVIQEPTVTTTRRFSPVNNDDTAKVEDDSIVYDISSAGNSAATAEIDAAQREHKSQDRGGQPAKRKSSGLVVDTTAQSERTHIYSKSPKKRNEDDSSTKRKKKLLLQVFLFERPDVFFEVVKTLLMVISAYNAFWLINFLSISTAGWKFLTLLPGLASVVIFTYIAKAAAVAKALYTVDSVALLEVLEQTEDAKQLAHEIREKLLQNLESSADPVATLYGLFRQIDDDGSNKLSRLEIEDLLMEFDLSFSQKKMRQIFHQIDRNFDDSISFEEFFIFLFPDHIGAKKMEEERIAKASNRLKTRLQQQRSQSQGNLEQINNTEP